MVSVLVGIQYIGIAILIVELIYVLSQKQSSLRIIMTMLLIAIIVNFLGYSFELQAGDRGEALMAVKIIYCGKPYIVLGYLLFVLEYFEIRLPKLFKSIIIGLHMVITLLVLECEHNNLYYSRIDFTQEGLFPHLVFGHGIVYKLYLGVLFVYLVAMVIICAIHYKKTSDIRERKRICCLEIIPCVSVITLITFFSGVAGGYDTTIIGYLISVTILMFTMLRLNLLDTLSLAKDRVLDELADGIVVIDRNENVIYRNVKAKELFNSLEEKNGTGTIEKIAQLCKNQELLHIADRIYMADEVEIVTDEKYYGKIYVVRDTTESYNYTINLEKQKAIAEQASRAKSDFLARMSHEIRTPINSVIGMDEMILRESNQSDVKKYAMNIRTSARFLLSIVNDILDSSKIESGKMEIMPEEYELDSFLNDINNMIITRVKDKGLEFNLVVDEKLPNVLCGDDVRLRQILINLLTNAVKYTSKGTVTISVTGERDGENEIFHYEVSDTGCGIKQEDMPKLFAAFERIEEDKNRNIEGTGLGMNIVYNLLGLMGSRLDVESVYGKGSKFSFDLAQKIVKDDPIGDLSERIKKRSEEYGYQNLLVAPDAHILVVDDNEINRFVFCCLLKETQVQITEAESGYECLKRVSQEHYDVIFLDHMMPGMNGVETLHKMRAMEENLCKMTPVIVLTANTVSGAKEKYIAEGFDGFMSKPLDPDKLEKLLFDILPDDKKQNNEITERTEY